jgi:hypothetical protein
VAIDIEQHPRDWKRRISNIELCLSTGSPAVKKLHKSYRDWQELGPEITEEYNKAVDALFDSWHEASKEIDKNNERIEDYEKWRFSVRLSLIAIVISALSISTSAFFQYQNLKISQERLSLQVKTVSATSKESTPITISNSKSVITTHNKSMQPTAKASSD